MVNIGPGIEIGPGITIEASKVEYSDMRSILSASGKAAYDSASSGNFFEVSQADFELAEISLANLYTKGSINRTTSGGTWVTGYSYIHAPYDLARYAGGKIIGMTSKFGSVASGASVQLATGTTYLGTYSTTANSLSIPTSGGTNRKFFLRKEAPDEASSVFATVKPTNGGMESPVASAIGYYSPGLTSWTNFAGGANQPTQFFYVMPATIQVVASNLKVHLVANSTRSVFVGSTSTWRDISGLGNTPTPNGTTSYTGSSYPAHYTMNGSNSYFNSGSGLLASGASFTKEAWIYRTSTTGSRNIISSLNAPFWFNGNTLSTGVNGNYSLVTEANVTTANAWMHVATTWNHATQTMTLYRNGSQVGQTTTSGLTYDVEPIYIGAHMNVGPTYSPVSYFQGRFSEIRIYNRALTGAEITQNYNASRFVMGQ